MVHSEQQVDLSVRFTVIDHQNSVIFHSISPLHAIITASEKVLKDTENKGNDEQSKYSHVLNSVNT